MTKRTHTAEQHNKRATLSRTGAMCCAWASGEGRNALFMFMKARFLFIGLTRSTNLYGNG